MAGARMRGLPLKDARAGGDGERGLRDLDLAALPALSGVLDLWRLADAFGTEAGCCLTAGDLVLDEDLRTAS